MFWIKFLCSFWVRVVSLNVFEEGFSQVLEATIYLSKHFQRLCCQLEGFKQNFFGKLLKLHSTCQDEHFDELFSNFKKFFKTHFATLNEDGRPFSKTLQYDRLNCKLYLQLIPLKTVYKFRRSKFFIICVICQKNVQPFGKKFQQRRKNCTPRVQRSFLRQKFSEKKSLLYFFLVFERKEKDILMNILWQGC